MLGTETMDLGGPRKPISWPGQARICLSVAIPFESFQNACTYRHGPGGPITKPDYFSLSYAEYGLKTGVWRLLDLMEAEKLKASFSMSGRAAGQLVRAIGGGLCFRPGQGSGARRLLGEPAGNLTMPRHRARAFLGTPVSAARS